MSKLCGAAHQDDKDKGLAIPLGCVARGLVERLPVLARGEGDAQRQRRDERLAVRRRREADVLQRRDLLRRLQRARSRCGERLRGKTRAAAGVASEGGGLGRGERETERERERERKEEWGQVRCVPQA